MKGKETGFTVIELLTSVAIIALLIGILIPSITMVRNTARNAAQKAQFVAIEQGIMAFRGDYGDYPPSDNYYNNYCGTQKLAEALMGWDLLGFHPGSTWNAYGLDQTGGQYTYDPPKNRDDNGDGILDTLTERRGLYLEISTANVFRLGVTTVGARDGLFDNTTPLEPLTFVLCDSFIRKKVYVPLLSGGTVTFNAGTPILYYKADTTKKGFTQVGVPLGNDSIYKMMDNYELIRVVDSEDGVVGDHPLSSAGGTYFYSDEYKIADPKASTSGIPRPYRPDSYILISAGIDGLYGTNDDITNF